MKTKTKTKTKLVVSICALTLIFTACKKDSVTPVPVLDCMGVENGVAISDNCGTCHQSYIYNDSSHVQTSIDDTIGLVLAANEMVILAGSDLDIMFNPYWNGGPLAAIDSCGDCHSSYIYDYVSHSTTTINDTSGIVLGATEMIVIAGSVDDIASNPNWNAGCTE